MYRILEDLDVEKVLCEEFDKRKKLFKDIKVQQLRNECKKRSLSVKGKKVK